MHSAHVFTVLALAVTTFAAPHRRHGGKGHIVYETVVHTAYETVIAGQPAPTPSPVVEQPAPVVTSVVVEAKPTPIYTPIYTPAPSSVIPVVEEPSSTVVAPVPSATAPSTSTGYMAIVDEYRTKLGLPALAQSSAREATALKTAQDGNGQMVHQLLPGTFGQVLAPGGPGDFKHVFVGGWLCEIPTLPGLNGECATQSEGWMYSSTGHADILTSDSYKNIGCANAGGIWACDLGW
jgi:uncharacterized protein YkwD